MHTYIGYGPFPVTVTTRIITFLVGNPYKPLFATVTGKGPHPIHTTSNMHFVKGDVFEPEGILAHLSTYPVY